MPVSRGISKSEYCKEILDKDLKPGTHIIMNSREWYDAMPKMGGPESDISCTELDGTISFSADMIPMLGMKMYITGSYWYSGNYGTPSGYVYKVRPLYSGLGTETIKPGEYRVTKSMIERIVDSKEEAPDIEDLIYRKGN